MVATTSSLISVIQKQHHGSTVGQQAQLQKLQTSLLLHA